MDNYVNNSEKVMVAMDFRNVNTPLCEIAGDVRKDYSVLLADVLGGRPCIAAFAYDSLMVDKAHHDSCQHTHDMLRKAGFTVRLSDSPNNMGKQGHVDVFMSLDVYRYATSRNVDVVELITGDGDLVPLVKLLQSEGIRVRVRSFRTKLCSTYHMIADEVGYLDSVPMIEMSPASAELGDPDATEVLPGEVIV